jgi:UDP-N-acetyl-2-amino-2-deoxyglucuronate dehydrogenase
VPALHNPASARPQTLEPLKIAVIGTGLGSAPHFASLRDLGAEVEVAWIYGRQANTVTSSYGFLRARKAASLQDILGDTSVAAALVLTPPNTHLEIVRSLAESGKHVLVEKPLDISLERATALVEACERCRVMLAVMLQHRMRKAPHELARLLHAGDLGRLVSGAASVRWWRPQSYYDEPGRGTLARDGGGVLITQAIHTLDLLLRYTGLPQRLVAVMGTSAMHTMEGEDHAAAILQFAAGASVVLQASTAAYPGFPERIELNLTRGSATLEAGKLEVAFISGESFSCGDSAGSGGGADPMAFDHAPHQALIHDFVRSIRSGGACAVSGRSALGVQRVIEAIVTSSNTGQAVHL